MHIETIEYKYEGTTFKGHVVYDSQNKKKRPGVLIAHAWMGQDNFAREKAKALAELGYVAFAADLYGNGKAVTTPEEAGKLMMPLFLDRKTLRGRIVAAYEALAKHPQVDADRLGAIGFCFGGLTVIELLRSGVKTKGIVCFHGVLGNKLGESKAKTEPDAKKLHGAILVLHGHDDPMVSQADIQALEKEFTDAGVDWQINIYGHTSHAFTNPEANDKERGLIYNPRTNKRAWQSMKSFFEDVFA